MDRRSKHLSNEERCVIFAEHRRGSRQRGIGRLLCRPASTIGRDLARRRLSDGLYCPTAARRVQDECRTRDRRAGTLVEGRVLHRFVHDHLNHRRWSPEHIAHRLRVIKPADAAARVSHETIYAAIYASRAAG